MVGLTPHAHPATTRLQLFHQHQQFIPGVLREDRAGHINDVGLEKLHQGEVLQHELSATPCQIGNAFPEVNVGGQKVHPNRRSAKAKRGRKYHLAAPTAEVVKPFALLQTSQTANLQPRKIGRFAETKVLERPVRERFALQVNVQRQKTPEVEKPHQAFHLD